MSTARFVTIVINFLLLNAFALLFSACAMSPQYSKSEDSFKAFSAKANRQYSAVKLCLILTENTNKTFDYLNGLRDNFFSALGATSGLDSKRLVTDVSNTLQSRFQEVTPVNSPPGTQSNSCDLSLGLDLKVTMVPGIRKEGIAEIKAVFADSKGAKIDAISVTASKNGWNSIGEVASSAWETAIIDFGSKLDNSALLQAFAVNLPAASGTSKQQFEASAAIDIAFWESIKNSTDPSDFQAYLKKFPDGGFASLARSKITSLGDVLPAPVKPFSVSDNVKFGNYYALVIGNNSYRSVTPLKTAVADAEAVAGVLQSEYGFKVTLLIDASRSQMLDAFDDIRRSLTASDNLLIYYAGHGYLDSDSDRGFWLPIDADNNRRANWLSNSDLADTVRGTRAKHVLVVADSCYSGTLTRGLTIHLTGQNDLLKLSNKRARTALTSGGLEPVEDAGGGKHSVFAKAFLDALKTNSGIVDMNQLFSSIRRQVLLGSQQTPQYGDIRQTGHDGGDFIFVRQKGQKN